MSVITRGDVVEIHSSEPWNGYIAVCEGNDPDVEYAHCARFRFFFTPPNYKDVDWFRATSAEITRYMRIIAHIDLDSAN